MAQNVGAQENYVLYWDIRNFLKVIDKAKESCKNAGHDIKDHFADVSKMVVLGSGAERQIEYVLNVLRAQFRWGL